MIKLSYCQETFKSPIKTVIDKDTVVCLSPEQINYINIAYIHVEECELMQKTFIDEIQEYQKINDKSGEIIKEYENQKQNYMMQIENHTKMYEALKKKNQKELRWQKIKAIRSTVIGITVGTVVGIIIGIFL
jgi:hypothetical protein